MPNEYKPLKNYAKHEENPYIPDVIENMQVRRKRHTMSPTNKDVMHYVVNRETGEVDGYSAFIRETEVDEMQFVKVFTRELRALWDLSKVASRVLAYVMGCMRMGEGSIYFDTRKCMEYTGYKSERSIINGVSELIEHRVLARSTSINIYFINPSIIFNGNRVVFVKSYVKKQRQKRDNQTIDMFERQKQLEAPSKDRLSEGQERWEEMQREAANHEQPSSEADTTD